MKAPIVYESAMLFQGIDVFPMRLAPREHSASRCWSRSKRANSRRMERCRFQREAPRFTSLCEETRHYAFRVVNSSGRARLSSNMRHLLESDKKRQSTVCSLCFIRDRTRRLAIGWILAGPPRLFLFSHAPLCCIHPTFCPLCVPPNQLPYLSAHSIESFFAKPKTR